MSLRLKILAIASMLLLVFAATTALSVSLVRRIMDEMSGIVEYHVALTSLVAEFDVLTFEYELNLRRFLLHPGGADRIRFVVERERVIGNRLQTLFMNTRSVLDRAVEDKRNDLSDRLRLARLSGLVETLGEQVTPFVAIGTRLTKALDERRWADANRLIDDFAGFEQAFGPDLARLRRTVEELTRESLEETREQSNRVRWTNGLLFMAASATGLGLFALLGYRLQQAFRRLLDGARQVREGQLTIELPVTSTDEIGQLTRSFNQMIVELRGKERIKETFGQFLDPRIAATLLGTQSGAGHPAERREVTIFFSDIRGFTGISEQLTADVMVRLLNAYFTTVTKIVREQNGIVDKYIGDAMMAFWTPPFSPGDQHAADACLAALAQQAAIAEFQNQVSHLVGLRRNVPDFRVRMGLATGEVVVGAIGSDSVKSYTVMGDTVNVASRLEGINKIYGASIMVSEQTFRLAKHAVEGRELDLIVVAGKTEPVRVFELLCRTGEMTPAISERVGLFAEGLGAYRNAEWEAAERNFRECLRVSPDDGPARAFLDRIPVLRAAPPNGHWEGVWALNGK